MKKKIFVSHAVKDKVLADSLVDLLQTGANVPFSEIFCSSLEGMGIPSGKNFVEYIKDQIQNPELVIILLTPNYFESHFCLCELGATWSMSHNKLVLIVPPLKFSDVKGVLSNIQMNKIENSDSLNEFIEEFNQILSVPGFSFARWDNKKKKFLDALPLLLAKLPQPEKIPLEKYNELVSHYNESQKAFSESEELIEELKLQIEKLKKCKDAKEVKAIIKEDLVDQEVFDELCMHAKKEIDKLPKVVGYFLYKKYLGHEKVRLNYYDNSDLFDSANNAVENGFLGTDEDYFILLEKDKKIKNAIKAIDELSSFLSEEASVDFNETFYEENDYECSLENKQFWKKYLVPANYYLN